MTILPSKPTPRFVLVHTNSRRERWFFVALGAPWPGRPDRRMISETTQDRSKATVFDTATEAVETLETAGEPVGWEMEGV